MDEPRIRIEDDSYWRPASRRQYLPVDLIDDDPYPQDDGPERRGGRPHVLREVAETILLTFLIFFVVRAVVQNFRVDGDSMLPTLHHDQYLLVNKGLYFRYDANFFNRMIVPDAPADMRYLFHGPRRGDIIVFESWDEPKDFIKRVIAVEGETIEVRKDTDPTGDPNRDCGGCGVFVNGVKLPEPYIKETPNYDVPLTTVPPGHVFVLGDNRRNSSDSHVKGMLDVDSIIGAAFMSYWPQEYWGLLPHPTYAEMQATPTPVSSP